MLQAFIDYISRTNLFNFIIFLSIIIFLLVKLNLKGMLDDACKHIVDDINEAENSKIESEDKLLEMQGIMSNLENEINTLLQEADDNAKAVGEKIVENANTAVVNINENTQKQVENSTQIVKNDILKRASIASVEVAKHYIIDELNKNSELHNKLIDESIDAISEVEL